MLRQGSFLWRPQGSFLFRPKGSVPRARRGQTHAPFPWEADEAGNSPIIDSGDGATDENGTESPKEAQDGTIGGEDAPE